MYMYMCVYVLHVCGVSQNTHKIAVCVSVRVCVRACVCEHIYIL
jgi:hypothetical protein